MSTTPRQRRRKRQTDGGAQRFERLTLRELLELYVEGLDGTTALPAPQTAEERRYVNLCTLRRGAELVADPADPAQFVSWREYPGGWSGWYAAKFGQEWHELVASVRESSPALVDYYEQNKEQVTHDEINPR